MITALLAVISALFFLLAYQTYWHELAMQRAEHRWAAEPKLMWLPSPPPQELEEPFPLVWLSPHPHFQNYGVDVSVAPTIPVEAATQRVERLPSFTMRGWQSLDNPYATWYNNAP